MRRRRWIAIATFILVMAGLGLLGSRDVNSAADDLNDSRQLLRGVSARAEELAESDGRQRARADLAGARAKLRTARRRITRSIPLRIASVVPGLRRSWTGLNDLVADADTAAGLAETLVGDVERAQEQVGLVSGQIPLAELVDFERRLQSAAASMRGLVRPSTGLLPPLHDARVEFNATARETADRLDEGARGLSVAWAFLGGAGPRRYLFAFENNAEMRDRGMMLSYGVANTRDGRIRFERTGPIDELNIASPADVATPPGLRAVFGDLHPTRQWRSINATADFAWTGQAASAMFTKATGDRIDGYVGVDVPALAAILRVIGPVDLDGRPVTADNAAQRLLHEAYQTTAQAARREKLADLGARVMEQLTAGRRDLLAMGRELAKAVDGGHVRVWSAHADEEQLIEKAGVGGGPALQRPDRTFHVAVQNATASKLDYYVRPELDVSVVVDDAGTATVRTRVNVVNTAPANAKPSYDLGPDNINTFQPGVYVARIQQWAPLGTMDSGSVEESGMSLSQRGVEVRPGTAGDVEFTAVIKDAIRNGRLELRFVPQPRLVPMPVTFTLSAPGWTIKDRTRIKVDLTEATIASWRLESGDA